MVAGIIALAATGGAIFAQGISRDGGTRNQDFAARVAEILGLDEATVQDAFRQAHQDQQDSSLQRRLDRLVAREKLTREQAETIASWYQARPVADLPLRKMVHRREETVRRHLDRLVEKGRITGVESDAVMNWWQEKPEALSQLSSRHGLFDRDSGSRGQGPRRGHTRGSSDSASGMVPDGPSRSFSPASFGQQI
jgi:hypothetical protein